MEIKTELKARTPADQFIQGIESDGNNMMKSFGLAFEPNQKKALFNIGLSMQKCLNDKGITWDDVNLDGLPGKVLDYSLMELNPSNDELYIIAYKGKNGKFDLNFEESYRGKRKKAKMFSIDDLIDVRAFVIREGDEYTQNINLTGEGDTVDFKPKSFNDGKVRGAFCYLSFEDKRKNKNIEMSLFELDKVKEASMKKMFNKVSPAWQIWESEMQKKSVIRRAMKEIEITIPVQLQESFMNTESNDNIFVEPKDITPEPKKIELKEEEQTSFDINTGEVKGVENDVNVEIPGFE